MSKIPDNVKSAKTLEELYEIITGVSSVTRGPMVDPRNLYTHDQWVNIFQMYEEYPEAIEAMKTVSSKLYKSLK